VVLLNPTSRKKRGKKGLPPLQASCFYILSYYPVGAYREKGKVIIPLFNLSLGGIKKHVVYNKNFIVLTHVYLHFLFGKFGLLPARIVLSQRYSLSKYLPIYLDCSKGILFYPQGANIFARYYNNFFNSYLKAFTISSFLTFRMISPFLKKRE